MSLNSVICHHYQPKSWTCGMCTSIKEILTLTDKSVKGNIQLATTNSKQQLFNVKMLKQTEKGLGLNQFFNSLLKMVALN